MTESRRQEGSRPCMHCGKPMSGAKMCTDCFQVLTTGKPESASRHESRKGQGGQPPQSPSKARRRRPWAIRGEERHSSGAADRMRASKYYDGVSNPW